ncbi:hypothetical protein [Sphaerisporangium sp. TRM90804]|uniref:aggregation-promoting factor C-terminal-like domain-containing protein n=1 Tax=Sphaerisporangium sp. TRM90804 TaxID=3031113 RepID=UPI002446BB46|nr:hypothetical protein [Sphaerisporangium sp. TRM90804]MDH2424147.1 hypothetical protein [Sphaerisporangium sp. TRM90804]
MRSAVVAVIATALAGTAGTAQAVTGSGTAADAVNDTAEPLETRTGPAGIPEAGTGPVALPRTRTGQAGPMGLPVGRGRLTLAGSGAGRAATLRETAGNLPRALADLAAESTATLAGPPVSMRAGLVLLAGIAGVAHAGKPARAFRAAKAARVKAAPARKAPRPAYKMHRGTWSTSARPRVQVWSARTPKINNKAIAFRMVAQRSWPTSQFRCLDSLWTRESNWNHRAQNPSSGAYGIPQALPGHKMVGVGSDWRVNPATQIRWGLKYIRGRYGSPCGAWGFFRSHNWY